MRFDLFTLHKCSEDEDQFVSLVTITALVERLAGDASQLLVNIQYSLREFIIGGFKLITLQRERVIAFALEFSVNRTEPFEESKNFFGQSSSLQAANLNFLKLEQFHGCANEPLESIQLLDEAVQSREYHIIREIPSNISVPLFEIVLQIQSLLTKEVDESIASLQCEFYFLNRFLWFKVQYLVRANISSRLLKRNNLKFNYSI